LAAGKKFFDPVVERIYKTIQEKIPEYEVGLVSTDKEEDLFVVQAFSDRTRPVFFLYDVKSGELTKLADSAPWLKAEDLAEMKPIEYKSRDGLTIHGYLTLPKGRGAKESTACGQPAWWSVGPRPMDIRSGVAISCESWICSPANEFPRVHRIWSQVLRSEL
jgi:hypothetical protein